MNSTVLFVIAAILVIVGIVQLFQGQIILGVVLIVAGLLVGPGGYSLFRGRHASPATRCEEVTRARSGDHHPNKGYDHTFFIQHSRDVFAD